MQEPHYFLFPPLCVLLSVHFSIPALYFHSSSNLFFATVVPLEFTLLSVSFKTYYGRCCLSKSRSMLISQSSRYFPSYQFVNYKTWLTSQCEQKLATPVVRLLFSTILTFESCVPSAVFSIQDQSLCCVVNALICHALFCFLMKMKQE